MGTVHTRKIKTLNDFISVEIDGSVKSRRIRNIHFGDRAARHAKGHPDRTGPPCMRDFSEMYSHKVLKNRGLGVPEFENTEPPQASCSDAFLARSHSAVRNFLSHAPKWRSCSPQYASGLPAHVDRNYSLWREAREVSAQVAGGIPRA